MFARTVDDYRPDARAATSAVPGVVRTTIRAMAERVGWALWRWYQVHQTRRQLSALPDYLLKDIGLSRSMLISATVRRVQEEEAMRRRDF